jgi:hypothetical protein
MPREHTTWRALGISDSALIRLTQHAKNAAPSMVSDLTKPVVKTFVTGLLGM